MRYRVTLIVTSEDDDMSSLLDQIDHDIDEGTWSLDLDPAAEANGTAVTVEEVEDEDE